jgi:16S rRNA U1498 N3-methylase RsmE
MSFKNIPRLYINKELKMNLEVSVAKKEIHYLKNVLRLTEKEKIRVYRRRMGCSYFE